MGTLSEDLWKIEELSTAMEKAKSASECVGIAKQHGFSITEEQVIEHFQKDMTPEELDNAAAAGGGSCCCCC
tara:strand:+ start:237 stop:452 length:216 start_codon:yes stop_codon:yes gene_type:complete